jgi:ATP-dependent DNA helicase DinG
LGESRRHELFLAPEAAVRIREEIARAGGNEVCLLLAVEPGGGLTDPRVVARGNSSTVLAAVGDMEAGQVLLHNHPSGNLAPSDADLLIAERLWSQGLGFAITDNLAKSLYVVVAPAEQRRLEPLDLDRIEGDLGPGGLLSQAHAGYEDRADQRSLSRLVARLYHREGIALTEAGTGIGKSIAYLLPAVRWALQNGERTVVSTNTINLQEQLVQKDLPFLRRALGVQFRFALVKGRNNYVSIRRAKLAGLNAASLFPDRREGEVASILQWVDSTRDGSLSDLPFRPSPEVWDEVASEADVCLRARCPHFEQCFYQRSRRDAASADILVVNHHLLFSDLAVRRSADNYSAPAVLPHYKRLILDEAHNLEETATRHLGATLTRRGFSRILRRLEHRGKGILPSLEKAISEKAGDLLARACLDLVQQRLRPELDAAWKRGSAVFQHLEGVARKQPGGMVRLRGDPAREIDWGEGVEQDLNATLAHLETLIKGLGALRERISIDEEAASRLEDLLLETRGVGNRLEAASLALRSALREGAVPDELVRWIEFRVAPREDGADEREGNVVVAAAPLDLGSVLRESLWERVPTIAMTSATLATAGSFDFARGRLGLDDDLMVEEEIFPSPFDFETQSVLVVPRDLPLPGGEDDRAHAAATLKVVEEFAEVTDGGIFVLFTSYRALRLLAEGLRRRGVDRRWPIFAQGEAPRGVIVERFVASGSAILLGTDSFWEGVDVPGDPLRGIVIPKLPFKVPSEPVTSARIEAIEARGGNSFTSYMLPHAAIRLKQGFGRLVRSRTDRGAVVILDGRLLSKSYGRYLVASLPPARTVVAPWKACREELLSFYGRSSGGPRVVYPAMEGAD